MNQPVSDVENLDAIQRTMVEVGSYLAARDYHAALAGNISVRIAENRLLCTRHGANKGALTFEDLVICDLEGNKIAGKGDPTSELNMHRRAYLDRPDVGAVVHAHPPTATCFAATSTPLNKLMLPEMVVLLGPVALVPYATPGSRQLGQELSRYLSTHDAFLLENHGALTVGYSLWQAAFRMELLEQKARITWMALPLGNLFGLSEEDRDALLEIRRRIQWP